VIYDGNPDEEAWGYNLYWLPSGTGSEGGSPPAIVGDETVQAQGRTPVQMCYWAADTDYQPHGEILYCGIDSKLLSNQRFVWIDKGTTMTAVCTAATAGFTVEFDQWNTSQVVIGKYSIPIAPASKKTPEVGALSGTVTILESAYYAISLVNTAASAVAVSNFQCALASSGDSFSHRSLPQYNLNATSAANVRILSESLMFTNTTPPIDRGGQIFILQSSAAVDWREFSTEPRKVETSNGAMKFEAKNGVYGWLRPTQPSDFNFRQELDVEGSVVMSSFFQLRNDSAYLVVRGLLAPTTTQTGLWTLGYGVEFETTNVWRLIEKPTASAGVYEQALVHLKDVPQFSENPSHISKLLASIGKVVRGTVGAVKKYGPLAMDIAELATPFL